MSNAYGGIGFCKEGAKTFAQLLLHWDHGMNNGRQIKSSLWRHKFPLGCGGHVSKFPIQSLYYPWFSTISNFEACLVFLGIVFSFIKLISSSDTLTKREAAILKICPPAIITPAEVTIAGYDAILGQWECENFYNHLSNYTKLLMFMVRIFIIAIFYSYFIYLVLDFALFLV